MAWSGFGLAWGASSYKYIANGWDIEPSYKVHGLSTGAVENKPEHIIGAVGIAQGFISIAGAGIDAFAGPSVKGMMGETGETLPNVIYRAGKTNPGNLTPRGADNGVLSFRSSLSNPYPLNPGQRPVFQLGDDYFGVDTSKLPPGSVRPDNIPPGHVGVTGVMPAQLKDAVIVKGRLPK